MDSLKPSLHTLLINYAIGLCKRNQHWPQVLADLGYDIQVIEQRIRNSKGEIVKPDIILSTNKHKPHALILECKGGITIDGTQLGKYNDIDKENFAHWVTVHSPEQLTFEVCLMDSDSNHNVVMKYNSNFAIITFESKQITKSHRFINQELDNVFGNPISLQGAVPPMNYYPFSENDDLRVIIPYVLRALVSMVVQKGRGGQNVLQESVFLHEDMLQRIHPYWRILSQDQQGILKDKVRKIVQYLMQKNPTLRTQIEEIQARAGVRVTASLQALQKSCEDIIAEMEKLTFITDFT